MIKKNVKLFIKKNTYIIVILYIFLIALIVSLIKQNLKEPFETPRKKRTVYNLIPSPNEENLYLGTFITLSKNKKSFDMNNFIYTNSLKSNTWRFPDKNSRLSRNHVITDLTYDSTRRLVAIGLKMKKGKPHYDIFRKKTTDFKSPWMLINSNHKIKTLCYDLKGNKLLGINSYDGQIYENKTLTDLSYGKWTGPINYDIPMKKIMFDKDGIMIGIGLKDNYIYKKKGEHWRVDKWDTTNVNNTVVYDLVYDIDGCFIASTPTGLKKQLHTDFGSEFVKLNDFDQKHDTILDKEDILKYKIGYEFIDNYFDTSTEFGMNLKKMYEFKKLSKDICSNKGRLTDGELNPNKQKVNSELLSTQNREINNLFDMVDNLSSQLNL